MLVSVSARSRARAADRRLRESIAQVTERMILQPIDAELEAYTKTREGLQRAFG